MKKIIAIMMSAALLACSACASNDSDTAADSSSQAVSAVPEQQAFTGKYFDTDIWEPVPMINQALIDAGYENGEAMQSINYVILDPITGQLGYFGTDVGGIYRTKDGGKSWHPCNIGYLAAGGTGPAIDPNNIQRTIMVGADGGYNTNSGLHLTTDGGENWKPVFMPGDEGFVGVLGSHYAANDDKGYDYRIQVAYDETSNDEKIGGSAVIYWSRENFTLDKESVQNNHPAIYKSTDGGETWAELPNTSEYAGGYIAVHPKDGRVAVSNQKGMWVSTDGGTTFTKKSELSINSLVSVRTEPDNLYALTNDGLYVSTDFGNSFKLVTEVLPNDIDYLDHLRVNPLNTDNMVMLKKGGHQWSYDTFYTKDGGRTWSKPKCDTSGMWIKIMSWKSVCWFSSTEDGVIIANERRSEDGGENFFMSTKGFNAICVGGYFSVNINDDRYMALASQDCNGAVSSDYGKTWNYRWWSTYDWGGYVYGSYAIDDKIAVAADSKSWWSVGELVYTKDGGETFVHTGLEVNGPRIGYAALGKENICFLGEWRTDDYCDNWTKMDGCNAVFAHDPNTGRLFGSGQYSVVYSDDDGVTWTKLSTLMNGVTDMDYNPKSGILYVSSGGKIVKIDVNNPKLIPDESDIDLTNVRGLCLDPENPDIMYAVQNSSARKDSGVMRSLDGGETWTQLMRKPYDGRENCPDGGYGWTIDFCKSTREIFVTGGCQGVWKMKAAPADATNDS